MHQKVSTPERTVLDPTIPDHELRLECSVRIWGRHEEIINIKPSISYPLGLHPSLSPLASSHVAEFMARVVLQPVQVMLNLRQGRLFEEETRQMEARIKESGGKKPNAPGATISGTQFPWLSPGFDDPRDDVARPPVDLEEESEERRRAA